MTFHHDTPPIPLVLFGASSLCGEKLVEQPPNGYRIQGMSRSRPPGVAGDTWTHCDLTDLTAEGLAASAKALPKGPQVWIAFTHIWLMAPFLKAMAQQQPCSLENLLGLVACSSSSAITKRFASNRFDRDLVRRLLDSHAGLEDICSHRSIPLRILAPTLIHGRSRHHRDRNVEALRLLMKRLPLLVLPAHTGRRQPIAASDLVEVAVAQLLEITHDSPRAASRSNPQLRGDRSLTLITVGGDETLTYREMLERIQAGDPAAARCVLLSVPTGLFQLLAVPMLMLSPKTFEAVLRIGADLCGFPSPAELLARPERSFRPAPGDVNSPPR